MNKIDRNYIYITLVSAILLCTGIGSVQLFDWDEINFAECAREMLVLGDYSRPQIAFQPFWEKPPLFIWIQALSMNMFGINEFAVRFPNAIIGLLALLVIYNIGKHRFDTQTGLLWCFLYAGSYLSFFYFKSGIIDPLFNLLMFLSIYYLSTHSNKNLIIAGLLTGLAVMTKGPVAWIVVGGSWLVYIIVNRLFSIKQVKYMIIWFITSLSVTALWFGYETYKHGSWFVITFIEYQIRLLTTPDSGHGGFLFYHWVILLVGMLPASVYFIAYLLGGRFKLWSDLDKMMFISFWLVLVLFTLVKTKIVHYSSFCYYPLTLLAARYISTQIQHQISFKRVYHLATSALMIMVLVVTAFIYLASHPQLLIPYIKDSFAVANLETQVEWPNTLYIIPVATLIVLLLSLFVKQLKFVVYMQASVNTLFLYLLMLLIIPRVESISQAAYIKMCRNYATNGAILMPYGFKSYAHLFYGRLTPEQCRYTAEELLNNTKISGNKYLICKKGKENELLSLPSVKLIQSENGYFLFQVKNE